MTPLPRSASLTCTRLALAAGLSFAALAAPCTTARADEVKASVPHPFAYGILVGSNAGGAGQQPLRYAEDDARRMEAVLRELGRYGSSDLRVLAHPDAARVLATIDEVGAKLRAHEARGEQAVLVFYYSGHAKANAFNLGTEELPIATLREKLARLPATLTLVLLDACQSGQYARTKGAEPAADFSFNSVSRLTTKGTAVLASSSAQELSQESDELRSSYFTHHFVVALRGAADVDGDGRVSLDEAYRYAYRRTLTSTAQTQVGAQHVTLVTDLAGQGDVAVTYPSDARSQLELPAALDARVLVQHKASGNVVAEVQKAPGARVRLAFAAGAYDAIVRFSSPFRIVRCHVWLNRERVASLETGGCEAVKSPGVAKGEEPDVIPERRGGRAIDPWAMAVGVGLIGRHEDAFTRRLNEFGYKSDALFPTARLHLGVSKGIAAHVVVGGQIATLSGDEFKRTASRSDDSFSWSSYAASAFVRASLPFDWTSGRVPWLAVYGQLGAGATLGTTTLRTGTQTGGEIAVADQTHWGYLLGGYGGLSLVLPRAFTFFLQAGYEYAPTIANLLGEVHDSGGFSSELGMRLRFE